MSLFSVYLLVHPKGSTYIGATVDLDHRLRQHNGEIKGGARATHAAGSGWVRVAHVEGFADWKSTLQFEWAWKHFTRQLKSREAPLIRRMKGLVAMLSAPRCTSAAVPWASLQEPLRLVFERNDATSFWSQLNPPSWDFLVIFDSCSSSGSSDQPKIQITNHGYNS